MFILILIGYILISILTLWIMIIGERRKGDIIISDFLMMLVISCIPLFNIIVLVEYFPKSSIFKKVIFKKRGENA